MPLGRLRERPGRLRALCSKMDAERCRLEASAVDPGSRFEACGKYTGPFAVPGGASGESTESHPQVPVAPWAISGHVVLRQIAFGNYLG